jgi:hypothetical protein
MKKCECDGKCKEPCAACLCRKNIPNEHGGALERAFDLKMRRIRAERLVDYNGLKGGMKDEAMGDNGKARGKMGATGA